MKTLSAQQPIGIFDSGIGGLTVAREIQKQLPQERIIYFGDTAHVPYGDKSKASIINYSERITRFLLEENCKAIIIACNTASAMAYSKIKKQYGKEAHIFNVIDPVCQYVSQKEVENVGVIGTKATISSRIYARKIKRLNQHMIVNQAATPLLAPMIEEGFFNNNISKTIIHSYLSKNNLKGIEAIILGCTHYPLIKKEVDHFYKKKTEVIDSAQIVVNHINKTLTAKKLLNTSGKPKHQFIVSDYTASFSESTEIFFGSKIKLKEVRLWD